jgi:hypothetical protein
MNPITLAAAALIIALSATSAAADCNAIASYDRRQACFAEQRQAPEGCASIKSPDDRELCRQRAGQRDLWSRRQDGFDVRR